MKVLLLLILAHANGDIEESMTIHFQTVEQCMAAAKKAESIPAPKNLLVFAACVSPPGVKA